MTQPNKDTPPSAIAYGSLSEHASKTQAEWEAENRNNLNAQFDQAIQGMVTLLGPIPILGDLLEIFTGKEDGDYNDFGTAFNRWKNFWGDSLKGLLDSVMDLLEPVKQVIDGLGDVGNQLDQAVQGGVKFITEGVAFVAGGIAGGLAAIGTAIADGLKGTQATLEGVGKVLFNVPTPEQFQGSVDGATQWFDTAVRGVLDLLGISTAKADTAISNNQLTNAAIFQGYTGVGGSGEVAQVGETMAAIRTQIFKGYTLESLSYNAGSSGAGTWVRPWENPQVSALLHGEGSDGSTVITDDSPLAANWTAAGNAKISTAQSKFGAGSISFDGSNGTWITPSAQIPAFGVDDFTIEFFVRFNSTSSLQTIFDFRPNATEGAYPDIVLDGGKIKYYANTDFRITGTTSVSTGVWYHVALCRSGSSTKLFLNGTQEGSTYTDTTDYLCPASRPVVGNTGAVANAAPFNGFIEELRITKSKARYTSNFTPPSAPFTADPSATVPKEFYVVAFGSGGGGGAGARRTNNSLTEGGTSNGGAGGAAGGYIAVEVDSASIPATVTYQIAAGGSGQTTLTTASSGAESSFGGYVTTQAGQYFVQNLLGYYTTNQSAPGVGGAGGAGIASGSLAWGTNGSGGASSQLAGGGSGGLGNGGSANNTPTGGSVGADAPLNQKARAGGGGGGGGGGVLLRRTTGGVYSFFNTTTPPYAGGLGGNGGRPGGGAGGGGGAYTYDDQGNTTAGLAAGNGGIGGHGLVILIWR